MGVDSREHEEMVESGEKAPEIALTKCRFVNATAGCLVGAFCAGRVAVVCIACACACVCVAFGACASVARVVCVACVACVAFAALVCAVTCCRGVCRGIETLSGAFSMPASVLAIVASW